MPEHDIGRDFDPDGELGPYSDPVDAYLSYLERVRDGAIGDCGFTLEDFRAYIKSLKKSG